ncbi:CPBP family intramembrane glutamic endopeptidase [Sphingomonas sp. MA1305]|uniref:CPBP family intramembrane glutamic endopeptidase n=1 Tax=Sphingomonas sp. MA1305 TaxID=2479204 RepID=UPI0018DEFCF0|nr:CPBP family intramembrane glutamic endopeptidase [Sphingomonas sp. MA1305]
MDKNEMRPGGTQAVQAGIALQLVIFLVAAAILIPALTPGSVVAGGLLIKVLFLARIAALVALADWMLRRQSLKWSDVGLHRPAWQRFLLALLIGAVMTFVSSAAARNVIIYFGLPAPNYSAFAPIKGNFGEYLYWAVPVTLVSAAFGEKLIFRGFVTDALRRLLGETCVAGPFAALLLQAVIFGALHFYQGAGGMIAAGLTGFALGTTWLIARRNLWAGIVLHAFLDGTAMTAIYLGYVGP